MAMAPEQVALRITHSRKKIIRDYKVHNCFPGTLLPSTKPSVMRRNSSAKQLEQIITCDPPSDLDDNTDRY
jgi:hypothetical protein